MFRIIVGGQNWYGLKRWFPDAQSWFVRWRNANLCRKLLLERELAGPSGHQLIAQFLVSPLGKSLIVGLISGVMDVHWKCLLIWLLMFPALSLRPAKALISVAAGRTS